MGSIPKKYISKVDVIEWFKVFLPLLIFTVTVLMSLLYAVWYLNITLETINCGLAYLEGWGNELLLSSDTTNLLISVFSIIVLGVVWGRFLFWLKWFFLFYSQVFLLSVFFLGLVFCGFYIKIATGLLYLLIGLLINIWISGFTFLKNQQGVALQNWPVSDYLLGKWFIFIGLNVLILFYYFLLVLQVQVLLIITFFIIGFKISIFIRASYNIKTSIICIEPVAEVLPFSWVECWVFIPFLITFFMYWFNMVQSFMLFYSFNITVLPLLFLLLLKRSNFVFSCYQKVIVFIEAKYTFIFIVVVILLIPLTFLNIVGFHWTVFYVVFNRSVRLLFLYDSFTIKTLHSVFCCGSSPFWGFAKKGAALSAAAYAAGQSKFGEFTIEVTRDRLDIMRQRSQLEYGLHINDEKFNQGAITREQHNGNTQKLLDGHIRVANQPITKVIGDPK